MKEEKLKKQFAKYTAIISAGLVLIVCLFMLVNLIQIKTNHPIESPAIDNLMKNIQNAADEQALREEIRVIDLLARKAYFNHIWQLKTGAWIAIFAALLFVFSYRYYRKNIVIFPVSTEKISDFWSIRNLERKWLFISVVSLAVITFALSVLTSGFYTDFGSMNLPQSDEEQKNNVVNVSADIAQDNILQDADSSSVDSINIAADFPADAEIRQNHPSFRGPYGLGISYKTKLPVEWDGASGKNIKWKKSVPLSGMNSPIIWGNFVFISGANDKNRKVFCYNRLNGSLVWTFDVKNVEGSPANSPKVTNDTGHAAAGLTTDGKRIYAIFSNGDLVAVDFEGKQVWAKNIGVPDNHYGHSSSLQFYKDKLIVQFDDNKACRLFALTTQTGKEIWKTIRSGKISWASPIIATKAGKTEIIVNNLPYVASYDVETGKEKWKVDCLSGEIGSSPAYADGIVFTANEYAKMVAIKDGKILWEGYDYLPDVSSPVAYKDMVFFTTSYGDMACFNQKDGALLWHHEFDGGFYGSPVIADGKIYCVDRSGTTVIVEAGRDFKLIGQAKLGEKSDCTPALADGMIYIRGEKFLYCISEK